MELVKKQYERHPFPNEDRREMYRSHGEYLKKHVFNGDSGKRVLEAGCGTGVMITDIASVIPDAEYFCIDFSEASIRSAKKYQERERLTKDYLNRMEFVQTDILDISDIGEFDLVESWGVIHHTEDPRKTFGALTSRIGPGGFIRIGVYGDYGNEKRRSQIRHIQSLVHGLPIEEKIKITRDFMNTPDYKPDLCSPPLFHQNRCLAGARPATDPEIVDEFLHAHEIHIRLEKLVAWFREDGIDVVDLTDWNNNPINMDVRFYTTNPIVIKRFEEVGERGNKPTIQQAEIIDFYARPYWIALLGKKSIK